ASGQAPHIQTVTTAWDEATHTLSIEARIIVSHTETLVEAHLIPRSYLPVLGEADAFPTFQHPIVVLKNIAEASIAPTLQLQTYRGTYQIQSKEISFWVSVHAWDRAGWVGLPLGVPFQTSYAAYLPLVSKQ
ncbi:MAG: hypothetical protein M3Q45_10365, partial [Chloroflexota bacterium]|nr:hypothetical protein [Chloroflexota bacterium]